MSDPDRVTPDEVRQATGKGVRILMIDSGVEVDHPALADRAIDRHQVQSFGGYLKVIADDDGDNFGHGTAVAAIFSQYASEADLTSLRVFGGDLRSTSARVLTAMHWGIEHRFDIINCSLSSPSQQHLADYKRVIDDAYCNNVLIVSACNNVDFRRQEFPGSFPGVIACDYGRHEGLSFSYRRGQLVEFVARGVDVRVAWKQGQYRTITGSSFAAPHLASVVARIRQLRPTWNVNQVKTALYNLADTHENTP